MGSRSLPIVASSWTVIIRAPSPITQTILFLPPEARKAPTLAGNAHPIAVLFQSW